MRIAALRGFEKASPGVGGPSAPDPASRRRRATAITTLVLGTILLGATVRVPRGSDWFVILGLLLAATWTVGALLCGPFSAVPKPWTRRPLLIAVGVGVTAFLIFFAASAVGQHLPIVSAALTSILSKADAGPSGLVVLVVIVNGIAEELFFRGALHALVDDHAVLVTTTVYVAVTAVSLNVALIVAAAVMGTIFSLERVATRGVVAPVITHVTWSTLMLLALPR